MYIVPIVYRYRLCIVCADWLFHFTLSVELKVNRTSCTQLEHVLCCFMPVKLFVLPAGPLQTLVIRGHGIANNEKGYQCF